MRALVIGRGSMGKRRIRDLTALGVDVESWDIEDGGICPSWSSSDIRIVSTPPMTHYLYADTRVPTFTEADVILVDSGPRRFPSATPLFTDWYSEVELETRGRLIYGYVLHVGQHLDDWHPGADPKTYYAYQVDNAVREMIPFELIWLTKLFGTVNTATGQVSRELATLTVAHEGGVVGRIFIDTVSRPTIRSLEFFGYVGRRWDLAYTEDVYRREMSAFVAAVKGEAPWPYSQAEEAANLEVLHTIERSG